MRRARPFWFALALVAVLLAIAGYRIEAWRGFLPRSVTVTGNHVVPTSEIVQRARISRTENLWLQNTRAAAARIEAIPYIKTASLHRGLPARLRIVVAERVPQVQIAYGAARVLADGDLRILGPAGTADALPLLVGSGLRPPAGTFVHDPSLTSLLRDEEALAQAHVVVAVLRHDRYGDLVAQTPQGVRLLLGDDADLAQKTALIEPLLSQIGGQGRPIAAVDLRAPDAPVVVYKKKPAGR